MQEVGKGVTGLKKKIGGWAKGVGYRAGVARMNNESPPFLYGVADKLVLSKVREALGLDRCKFHFSGAAPQTKDTLEFFGALGININEVYGMSECTSAGECVKCVCVCMCESPVHTGSTVYNYYR